MKKRRPIKKSRSKNAARRGAAILLTVVALLSFAIYHYRESLAHYFSFRTRSVEEERLTELHNFQVLSVHGDKSIGFDVSEYQGVVNWFQVDSVEGAFKLDFVFLRATAGKDVVDKRFADNWAGAGRAGFLRGAYHYYRPNENSYEQADNFIKTVHLKEGDLPPVLDIEKLPEEQSLDSLKVGLRRWLTRVEKHYGVKPIIYSGDSYYNDFLKAEFSEYAFWIANYNFFVEEIDPCWTFWQFTEKASVPGVLGEVDVNIFNGTRAELQNRAIRK
ncbi:MAG: glycoside hydrolase family 25 protein [Flavobacterium sp.]|nr:MAG: glycoside hydrolase family 25 protein [Flavobacterium sp.]